MCETIGSKKGSVSYGAYFISADIQALKPLQDEQRGSVYIANRIVSSATE